MMKVAINTIPLRTAHKYRGIGYYTKFLVDSLKNYSDLEVLEFSKLSDIGYCDVIHYPWFDLFFHTFPFRKPFPTVVTIHDVIPLIFPNFYPKGVKGEINFFLQKISLRGCKNIITDSSVSKKDIVKFLKIPETKITVIPLAPADNFKVFKKDTSVLYIKKKYHLPDRFLLYVGDANPVKNLPFLIEGFHEILKKKEMNDLKLVLVGGIFLKNVENIDHPELKGIKDVNRLIKQFGLEEKIIKPGFLEDEELAVFYNLATLYIQPSLYEGFGLPILEAFSCGTPVVSSNRGSLPEVGGNAAVYFDPQNLKQMVEISRELIEDPSLQSKLSKLGLERVSKFSWKETAEQTKSIYLKSVSNV